MRKTPLVSGEIYHIFSRSIAEYRIFNNDQEYQRMWQLLKYYQIDTDVRLSFFLDLIWVQQYGFNNSFRTIAKDKKPTVQIIAYCLMPTHIHLVLKQLAENGISEYMSNVLNGYSRFFNTTHKRKGPLWESRFKSVLVENDDQLNHLIRYLHLNATTAGIVKKPEDWPHSSYNEYLGGIHENQTLCKYDDLVDIKPTVYRKFVNDQISYQQELAKIKHLILES